MSQWPKSPHPPHDRSGLVCDCKFRQNFRKTRESLTSTNLQSLIGLAGSGPFVHVCVCVCARWALCFTALRGRSLKGERQWKLCAQDERMRTRGRRKRSAGEHSHRQSNVSTANCEKKAWKNTYEISRKKNRGSSGGSDRHNGSRSSRSVTEYFCFLWELQRWINTVKNSLSTY